MEETENVKWCVFKVPQCIYHSICVHFIGKYHKIQLDFPPFEILYGRHISGPLTIIIDSGEEPKMENMEELIRRISFVKNKRNTS